MEKQTGRLRRKGKRRHNTQQTTRRPTGSRAGAITQANNSAVTRGLYSSASWLYEHLSSAAGKTVVWWGCDDNSGDHERDDISRVDEGSDPRANNPRCLNPFTRSNETVSDGIAQGIENPITIGHSSVLDNSSCNGPQEKIARNHRSSNDVTSKTKGCAVSSKCPDGPPLNGHMGNGSQATNDVGTENKFKSFTKNNVPRNATGKPRQAVRSREGVMGGDVFPVYTIWLVHVVTLCTRVYTASRKENMWILHPDEVYQSVEVAHSEVYGYGFRPYEYLPPPAGGAAVAPASLSVAERQELAAGMYSLRSFLWPSVFVVVLWIKEALGSSASPLLVAKVFHAAVAAHLPICVHQFTHALFPTKRDIAVLAAILVTCSEQLGLLGTHCLINSFLSPFVFGSLGALITAVSHLKLKGSGRFDSAAPTQNGRKNTPIGTKSSTGEVHAFLRKQALNSACSNLHAESTNDKHGTSANQPNSNGALKSRARHVGDIGRFEDATNDEVLHNSLHSADKQDGQRAIDSIRGTILSTIAGGRENGYYSSAKGNGYAGSLSDTKGTDDVGHHVLSNGSHVTKLFREKSTRLKENYILSLGKRLCIGVVFGVSIYMRVDLVLLIGIMAAVVIIEYPCKVSAALFRCLMTVSVGGMLGVAIGGYVDYVTYGTWFLSPYQWFHFNVRSGHASALFGSQDVFFYTREVFLCDPYMVTLVVLINAGVIVKRTGYNHRLHDPLVKDNFPQIVAVVLLLCAFYSLQAHKEVRFIHNLIVLFLVMSANCIEALHTYLLYPMVNKRRLTCLYIIVLLGLNFRSAAKAPTKTSPDWAYMNTWDSGHVNGCLDFVGRQPDATGVFIDRSIHVTGGFSVLHRDIPIFSLVHFEFEEFSPHMRKHIPSAFPLLNENMSVSVNVMNRVSNFISVRNSALLLKYLIQNHAYNYVVLLRTREVISEGFEEVYRQGTMKVLKRTSDPRTESNLQSMARDIPVGLNATVLEYEGSWLHTLGLYQMSVERLEAAISLDPYRIRAYQILSLDYNALGRTTDARRSFQRCQQLFAKECMQPQPRLVLHSDYDLNMNLE